MIESILQLQIPGLPNAVPIAGGVSRIFKFGGQAREVGYVKNTIPNPGVWIYFLEWANKEASEYVFEEERSEWIGDDSSKYDGPGRIETEIKVRHQQNPAFDSNNEEHVRQWDVYRSAPIAPDAPPVPDTPEEAGWYPSILEEYPVYTEVLEVWKGGYVADPIRERTLILPLELALQVIALQVPGENPNPQERYDNLVSNLYRAAASLAGQFVEPKTV